MATWNSTNVILTRIGEQILSKVQGGVGSITISRIVTGGGYVAPALLYSQTAISNIKQEAVVTDVDTTNQGSTIAISVSNADLEEAYSLYQLGIYVTHPDFVGEQLYLIAQCNTESPDEIPLPETNLVTFRYSLYMVHAGTTSVTVQVDPTGVLTVDDLGDATPQMDGVGSAGISSKLARVDHVHPSDTNKLGKTDDGKDVVISFSAAASRSNLATGEKLSVMFGKIAKWFSDLGSLAFKSTVAKTDLASGVQTSLDKADSALQSFTESDPTVPAWAKAASKPTYTKSEVGLGSVPNVSTNDQTPTFSEAAALVTLTSGEKLSVSLGKVMKAITDLIAHRNNTSNPHGVTKTQVGLGNVDNTSDASKPVSTVQASAIATAKAAGDNAQSALGTHTANQSNPHAVSKAQVGLGNVPNVATNDQVPTYTEADTLATLVSGEKLSVSMGKIMKAISDFITHKASTANPHGVTKTQVGLGNVDNTSDANKPVSSAQSSAIGTVQSALNTHTSSTANPHGVTKSQVGLGNVPNVVTNDQTPTFTEATALANLSSGEKLSISLGKIMKAISEFITHKNSSSNPHGVTSSQVGLGNVPNVITNNQTPTYTAAASNTALASGETLTVAFGKIAKAISSLITHLSDTVSHVTSAEKSTWGGKANKVLYTATIAVSAWSAATVGYACTVSVSGIISTDTPVVGLVQTSTPATNQILLENMGLVSRIVTSTNSITLYAYEGAPVVALPVQIMCIR